MFQLIDAYNLIKVTILTTAISHQDIISNQDN